MIAINDVVNASQIKLKVKNRDLFMKLSEKDNINLINESRWSEMFFCFAIGFHRNFKNDFTGGESYVNYPSLKEDVKFIASLILERDGDDIDSVQKFWTVFESYCEGGYYLIMQSLENNNGRFILDDIMGDV